MKTESIVRKSILSAVNPQSPFCISAVILSALALGASGVVWVSLVNLAEKNRPGVEMLVPAYCAPVTQ